MPIAFVPCPGKAISAIISKGENKHQLMYDTIIWRTNESVFHGAVVVSGSGSCTRISMI